MRARARAHVGSGGRLVAVHSQPPLTIRRISSSPGECALCLVGTAAGPLAGDDLELRLDVDAGASASLCATGAAIAQGGAARLHLHARVDGRLVADPGPVVVCRGADVELSTTLRLGAEAHVEWRELLVLGRTADTEPGRARIAWDVERAGRAVLRQSVDLADPRQRRWACAGARVVGTALISGPDVRASTRVDGPFAVAAALDDHTVLVTVLGDSAAEVQRSLDRLSACRPPGPTSPARRSRPPQRSSTAGSTR